jgi:hypothetical protein
LRHDARIDLDVRAVAQHLGRSGRHVQGDHGVRHRRCGGDERDAIALGGDVWAIPWRGRVREVEVEQLTGGRVEDREVIRAVGAVGARDAAVTEEAVVGQSELPLRPAELRGHRGERDGIPLVAPVEIPPPSPIGDEMQLAGGAPDRLLGRLPEPPRHQPPVRGPRSIVDLRGP